MKKSLICITAAAVMMFATVTSYAAGSYDTQNNEVTYMVWPALFIKQ